MNILDRLNAVIDYVENNIIEDIDLTHLANIACSSSYNFQRMFTFITEVSIVEYIRRRRITLAAFELQHSDIKIIDLALKFGYESPVSFARAFQAVHGITPSEARKSNTSLKAFPRITFQIIIKGVNEMDYRIVKTSAFQVFGLEGAIPTNTYNEINFDGIAATWGKYYENGGHEKLEKDSCNEKLSCYSEMFVMEHMCPIHAVSNYRKNDESNFGYMLCSFVTSGSKHNGYSIVDIPATTWAVFPSDLDDDCGDLGKTLLNLAKRFYSEWLPTSEYELADSPNFEMQGWVNDHSYWELWFPIIKKV
jgi:AraC family transcriptional regulator